MDKKKIALNAISSAAQVVFIGLIYFFLYQFLFKNLGVELLGVWSVVMATSSIANLANFGVATSVVRYVALYSLDNNKERINQLVFTAALFILALFLILSMIFFPFARILIGYSIDAKYIPDAIRILPYSIACLIINSMVGVYGSVLDGLQKNYIRSIIFSLSAIVLIVLTYSLTERMGILGVVIAQLLQSVFTVFACLAVVIKTTKYHPFKWQWDKLIFKDIFSYGIKFQFISLTAMLNEPITKLLLAKYGGLQFTGFYEMGNRLVVQLKSVIVSANQSLIPLMIKGTSPSDEQLKTSAQLYKISLIIAAVSSLFLFSIPILSSELISIIWIGYDEPLFSFIMSLVALSMYVNLLCAPAYFALLAEGKLNPIIISQAIIGFLNLALGYLFGNYLHGYGIVFAWIISVSIGSIFLIKSYHHNSGVAFFTFARKEFIYLFVQTISIISLKQIFAYFFVNKLLESVIFISLIVLVYIFNLKLAYSKYKRRKLNI